VETTTQPEGITVVQDWDAASRLEAYRDALGGETT
jgi:YD repeat-containing protein